MRRLAAALLGLVACGTPDAATPEAQRPAAVRHVVVQDVAPTTFAEVVSDAAPEPSRDPLRIATLLETRSAGTYLPELLERRDGWSYRWPERRLEPLRVWIERSAAPAYQRDYYAAVQDAFEGWAGLGLPFVFVYVNDSARAEVHVTWVDRFSERMTGRTLWRHDRHGWIAGGRIELALHLPDGRAVTLDGVRAVALHEVGHLIGLDHPADETSVMAAQVFVTHMSEADRRTARLVYDLPPGRLLP